MALESAEQYELRDVIGAVYADDQARRDATERLLTTLNPWLFGPKCLIPALAQVVQRVDEGGRIAPGEFYNFCWIMQRDDMAIVQMSLLGALFDGGDLEAFPAPSPAWFRGWERECA